MRLETCFPTGVSATFFAKTKRRNQTTFIHIEKLEYLKKFSSGKTTWSKCQVTWDRVTSTEVLSFSGSTFFQIFLRGRFTSISLEKISSNFLHWCHCFLHVIFFPAFLASTDSFLSGILTSFSFHRNGDLASLARDSHHAVSSH